MGILDRINTLVRSNVNDLMRRADEPERALDGSIGEMERSIREARVQLRQCEQTEASLLRQLQRGRQESLEWEDKALEALRGGDENLARECLVIKKKVDARAGRLREELAQHRDYVADLARSLDALEVKLDAVRSRRHSISRHVGGESSASMPARGAERGGSYTFPDFSQGNASSAGDLRSGHHSDRGRAGDSRRDDYDRSGSGGHARGGASRGDAPRGDASRGSSPGDRVGGSKRAGVGGDQWASQGRRAFVFDEEMRREYPEEVFDAGRPFAEFDRMQDRIEGMDARLEAERSLGGYEDPLRDRLADRFRQLQSQHLGSEGIARLKARLLNEQSDRDPGDQYGAGQPSARREEERGGSTSGGGGAGRDRKLSDLRRRLAEELDE